MDQYKDKNQYKDQDQKYSNLIQNIKSYGKIAVAFSGGVDSCMLLVAAMEALGAENVIAVTADSIVFPNREFQEAKELCEDLKVRQITFNINQLDIDGFSGNPENRCYICKKNLMGKIFEIVRKNSIEILAEGSNADDISDYRPGMQAIRELKIVSPLMEAGLTKQEIREILKSKGIKIWNKQSFACLATRFVYGETIDEKRLDMVDKAEQTLIDLGFHQLRVRVHGEGDHPMARIELTEGEISEAIEPHIRDIIINRKEKIGFSYVTLDIKGYKTGSMNQTIHI